MISNSQSAQMIHHRRTTANARDLCPFSLRELEWRYSNMQFGLWKSEENAGKAVSKGVAELYPSISENTFFQ